MTRFSRTSSVSAVCFIAALAAMAVVDDWTRPVDVVFDGQRCISYRARLDGSLLVVEATPAPGWHTFAMDNKRRAEEKLAGRKSLGIELPTEIGLSGGLESTGPWFQSPPKDFSKPEMRWYSWGFEGPALFVANVRKSGPGPAKLAVHGQVCTDTTCKNVDVAISLPLNASEPAAATSSIDLNNLVQVR
jgi:hypothetical protein